MTDTLLFSERFQILTIHSLDGYDLFYPKNELVRTCVFLNNMISENMDLDEIDIPFSAEKIDAFLRFCYQRNSKTLNSKDNSNLFFGKSVCNGHDVLTFLIQVSEVADYMEYVRISYHGYTLEEEFNETYSLDIDIFEKCPDNNDLNIQQWRYLFVSAKWYLDHLIETNDEYC